MLGKVAVLVAVAFMRAELAKRTVLQFTQGWVSVAPVVTFDLFAVGTGLYLGDAPFAVLCGLTVHTAQFGMVELRGVVFRALTRHRGMSQNRVVNR